MKGKLEGKFGINRPGLEVKHNFGYNMLSSVNVGIEGEKLVTEIETRGVKHGKYFFKRMYEEEESFKQLGKYKHFKDGGVSVAPVFKPVKLEDGEPFAIITDLTENGKYWVLSTNNPEVYKEEYKRIAKSVPAETRKKIIEQLVLACEVAVKPSKNMEGEDVIYRFGGTAFMLALNPNDVSSAKIYVADLGLDVREERPEKADELLRENIMTAALFYTHMTGEPFIAPEKYKDMADELAEDAEWILERREF